MNKTKKERTRSLTVGSVKRPKQSAIHTPQTNKLYHTYLFKTKGGDDFMVCPKCGSSNVNIQMVNEVKLKNKHHGLFWWLFIGWWWIPFKWLFLTLPALLFKIFGHKKQKAVNKQKTMCTCQQCGHSWEK